MNLSFAGLAEYVEYLVGPGFVQVYCGVLILIFLVFLSRLIWKYRRLLRDLRRAGTELDSVTGPEDFWQQYPSFDNSLRDNRSLGHAWSEFTESLMIPRESDDRQVLRNGKEPSRHFDIASIVEPHINIRGYNAIPNYLTGLGILGTFVGLAAGIYLAEPYLASTAAVTDTAKGLQFLLRGASLAFLTSITGLITSIVFLFTERSLLSKLARAIGDWNASLDAVLVLATPSNVAIDQLRELRQQTTQLKTFNTDLAASIAAALDEKIAGRLVPELERLVTAVEGLRNDRSATSEGMVERVVEELRQSLTGAAGNEMSALAGTLEQLNETLSSSLQGIERTEQAMAESFDASRQAMSGAIDESMKRLSEEMTAASQQLTRNLEESARSISETLGNSGKDAADRFRAAAEAFSAGSAEQLDNFVRGVAQSGTDMTTAFRQVSNDAAGAVARSAGQVQEQTERTGELLEEISRATASLSTVTHQIKDTGVGLNQLGPRLNEAANSFQTASERIVQSTSEMSAMSRQTAKSAEALALTQQALREAWESHLSRFERTDEALERVFAEIDAGLERFVERVTSFNREFDSEMSDAVGLLGGAIRELGEVLEDSIDALTEREREI